MNDAAMAPSAELIEARWQQSQALYELCTRVWAERPELARRAGRRVEELMMPLDAVQARYAKEWSALQ